MGERKEELPKEKLGFEERVEKKEEYLELKSQLVELQKNETSPLDSTKVVHEVLMQSNKMVDGVLDPQILSLDADLLCTASNILVKNVETLTNDTSFSAEEFGDCILRYVGHEHEGDLSDGKKWERLYDFVEGVFYRSQTPFFMRNHIDNLDEASTASGVVKQRKHNDVDKAVQAKGPENARNAAKEEDGIEESVEHMMGVIVSEYRKNGNKPICFFSLVINPDSFSATVENIYHFSFLVKDRKVDFIEDDNGDPRVVPVLETRSSDSEGSQCIFSITMPQWEELKTLYKIERPMITPRH